MLKTINPTLPGLIQEINSKLVVPVKIYKSQIGKKFTIEIEEKEPQSFTSILYKKAKDRDADFSIFDETSFWSLPFNPNVNC